MTVPTTAQISAAAYNARIRFYTKAFIVMTFVLMVAGACSGKGFDPYNY